MYICTCMYGYMYVYLCVYIHIYVHIERALVVTGESCNSCFPFFLTDFSFTDNSFSRVSQTEIYVFFVCATKRHCGESEHLWLLRKIILQQWIGNMKNSMRFELRFFIVGRFSKHVVVNWRVIDWDENPQDGCFSSGMNPAHQGSF